jgi:hypothetical protein
MPLTDHPLSLHGVNVVGIFFNYFDVYHQPEHSTILMYINLSISFSMTVILFFINVTQTADKSIIVFQVIFSHTLLHFVHGSCVGVQLEKNGSVLSILWMFHALHMAGNELMLGQVARTMDQGA